MAGSGASGIECLDPPPLGRVELEDAKARVGGRIFIKGNIDPVHAFSPATGDRPDARRGASGQAPSQTACRSPRTPPVTPPSQRIRIY
jgi:hypothetical protein